MIAKNTAFKPLIKSSLLIVGPTNSDLLNSITLSSMTFLTSFIIFILSEVLSFCNFIMKLFELPNSWIKTLSKLSLS